MIDAHHGWNRSFKPQIWGLVLSVILTLIAFYIVTIHHITSGLFTFYVMGLAVIQAIVQLVSFMQLGIEEKPRWNLMIFLFMVLVIVVIIGGSMWIMYNLNYNVHLPGDIVN